MNPFEFILAIVAIVTIGNIIRARRGLGRLSRRDRRMEMLGARPDDDTSAENRLLREEVQQLKDRVKVLERIAVDKENSLAREIEDLRGR